MFKRTKTPGERVVKCYAFVQKGLDRGYCNTELARIKNGFDYLKLEMDCPVCGNPIRYEYSDKIWHGAIVEIEQEESK